ncbi:hypothetical protein [Moorena sp. SIO1G6]|nr:hypothetical protein [Moorena sp. SIO1G6]
MLNPPGKFCIAYAIASVSVMRSRFSLCDRALVYAIANPLCDR